MWQCQQPSAAWPGFLGRGLCCAPYGGPVLGARGPCSPRSADGPVIIISRPVLPDHFLTPWTAVSLASLRRHLNSHFSSVLYFVHNINLYCDPALGSIHLCLTSGKSSPGGLFSFFFLGLYKPRKKETIRIVFQTMEHESKLVLILAPKPPFCLWLWHNVAKRNKKHFSDIPSITVIYGWWYYFLMIQNTYCDNHEDCWYWIENMILLYMTF